MRFHVCSKDLSFLVLLVAVFVFSAANSWLLFSRFGFIDDYYLLRLAHEQPSYFVDAGIANFRLAQSLFVFPSYYLSDSVSGLGFARLLSLGFFGAAAAVSFAISRWLGFSPLLSLVVGGLGAATTGTTVFLAWVVLGGLFAAVVPMSLIAGYLLSRALAPSLSLWKLIVSSGLILVLFSAYPNMPFLSLGIACLVALRWRFCAVRALLFVLKASAVVLVCGAFSYLVATLLVRVVGVSRSDRVGFAADPAAKITFLRDEVLPSLVDPFQWTTDARGWSLIVFSVTLFVFVSLSLWRPTRRDGGRLVLTASAVSCALAAPALIGESWASARFLLPGQLLFIFVGVYIFRQISLAFMDRLSIPSQRVFSIFGRWFITVFTCSVLFTATVNLYDGFVHPQTLELRAAERVLETLGPRAGDTVLVRGSQWSAPLAARVVRDEYGFPSTAAAWVPVPLVQQILLEQGVKGVCVTDDASSRLPQECGAGCGTTLKGEGTRCLNIDFGSVLRSVSDDDRVPLLSKLWSAAP